MQIVINFGCTEPIKPISSSIEQNFCIILHIYRVGVTVVNGCLIKHWTFDTNGRQMALFSLLNWTTTWGVGNSCRVVYSFKILVQIAKIL